MIVNTKKGSNTLEEHLGLKYFKFESYVEFSFQEMRKAFFLDIFVHLKYLWSKLLNWDSANLIILSKFQNLKSCKKICLF